MSLFHNSDLCLRLSVQSCAQSTVSTQWRSLSSTGLLLPLNEVMHVPLNEEDLRDNALSVTAWLRPPERAVASCQIRLAELFAKGAVSEAWYGLSPNKRLQVPHGSLTSRVLPYVVPEPVDREAEPGAMRPTSLALGEDEAEAKEEETKQAEMFPAEVSFFFDPAEYFDLNFRLALTSSF